MVNLFFNANYYLANNSDLVAAGLHTPEHLWEHYITYGAQERADLLEVGTIDQTSHIRQPNEWFNAGYYLATYPDLVAAGITAAQALDHYYQYGIDENRSFSPNPELQPNKFTAKTYAQANPDVREHYGIQEGAELTAQDKANLLKHYLTYGYTENREGAGDDFVAALKANSFNIIHITEPISAVGTLANDKFVVGIEDEGIPEPWYIDGAGGSNAIIFDNSVHYMSEGAASLSLRNIQTIEINNEDAYVAANVSGMIDSLTLTKAAGTTLFFNDATGTNDSLDVVVKESGSLLLTGIETVNLNFDSQYAQNVPEDSLQFQLNALKSQGANQTINLQGGNKKNVGLEFDNVGSPDLSNLTINGSGLLAGLGQITLVDEAQNITNLTIQGSTARDNTFTINGVVFTQNLKVIGASGNDSFSATAAIDEFTGGRGDDSFDFKTGANSKVRLEGTEDKAKIVGIDTITDFKAGDKLIVANEIKAISAETGSNTGTTSLEDLILKATSGTGVTDYNAFNFGGNAYVVLNAGETDLAQVEVVKLMGVDATKLTIESTSEDFTYSL